MIKFQQKQYSEYDAMRSLYKKLMERSRDNRQKYRVINSSALIPILNGNSVVIERFVISTSMFGKDRYRMYLKIGAKAKLPDEVRLPGRYRDKRLGELRLNFNGGVFGSKKFSDSRLKLFADNKKKDKQPPMISTSASPYIDLSVKVQEILGEAIKYDKRERSIILEFRTIDDAVDALDILPFGLNYTIYLLNA